MPKAKVACVNLAYDNSHLQYLLRQRGGLLVRGQFKKAKEFELKILAEMESNKDKYTRPVVAFVIFETFDCQQRCYDELQTKRNVYGDISYNKSGKAFTVLGEKLELEEVGEPSDLNWEYVGYPRKLIFRNQIIVIFSMSVFLLGILYLSTIIQVSEYNKVKMYPALKDCESIKSQF